MMDKIYIIDAAAYLFRSYHAIYHMTNDKGESTNALYGFIRSVEKIIKDFQPKHIVAVFDGPDNKKSRTDVYEKYKAHREGMPEDLFPQLKWAIDYCEHAGIPNIELPGVEADDTIGAIAKWAEKGGARVFMCTNDKDLAQLVSDKVVMVNTYKDNAIMTPKGVVEHYGVHPSQIADYLALMGDASDGIPGVPGVGKKTAADLLSAYGSVDAMLNNPEIIENEKKRARIVDNEEILRMCQKLAQLYPDLKVPTKSSFYEMGTPDTIKMSAFYREKGFFSLLKSMDSQAETQMELFSDEASKGKYHLVDDVDTLEKLVERLSKEKELCLDTETTHKRPMQAELVGVGLGYKAGEAWYIPLNGELGESALELLRPLLESEKIDFYGHNIKYDLHVLMNTGIEVKSLGFDTIIASYLLAPHKNRHGLDQIVLEHFNVVNLLHPLKNFKKYYQMEYGKIFDISDTNNGAGLYNTYDNVSSVIFNNHYVNDIRSILSFVNVLNGDTRGFAMERHVVRNSDDFESIVSNVKHKHSLFVLVFDKLYTLKLSNFNHTDIDNVLYATQFDNLNVFVF